MGSSAFLKSIVNESYRNGKIDSLKQQELLTILDDMTETEAGSHKTNPELEKRMEEYVKKECGLNA